MGIRIWAKGTSSQRCPEGRAQLVPTSLPGKEKVAIGKVWHSKGSRFRFSGTEENTSQLGGVIQNSQLMRWDYLRVIICFLKRGPPSQKKVGWWLVPFRAGGELIFPPDDKVKKQPLFPLGFEPRTSRVLGERDDHYTTETHITLQFWGTQFLLRWIMKGFTATSYKRITKTNKQKTLLQIRPIKNT